jgi:hypothetical protein
MAQTKQSQRSFDARVIGITASGHKRALTGVHFVLGADKGPGHTRSC